MRAKIFKTGRSQAVRLPMEFRFDVSEVYIRRGGEGEVVLSTKPEPKPWKAIYAALDEAEAPKFFLEDRDSSAPMEREF